MGMTDRVEEAYTHSRSRENRGTECDAGPRKEGLGLVRRQKRGRGEHGPSLGFLQVRQGK